MQHLRKAQDVVFAETIKRNFAPCPVNPSFYIFQDNSEDSIIQKVSKKSEKTNPEEKSEKKNIFAVKYKSNLKGTPDAFSEAESEDSLGFLDQSKVFANQKPKK